MNDKNIHDWNDLSDYDSLPALLDSKQAAEILNCDPRTITRMCNTKKLKAVKVMSMWRINKAELLKFAGLD